MTPFEAREHRDAAIATALLRNHVRLLLDTEMTEEEFAAWRVDCERLFDRYHWWDLEGRNVLHRLNKESQ